MASGRVQINMTVSALVPPASWRILAAPVDQGCDAYIPVSSSPRSIALLQATAERLACTEPDTEENLIRWAEMEDDDG